MEILTEFVIEIKADVHGILRSGAVGGLDDLHGEFGNAIGNGRGQGAGRAVAFVQIARVRGGMSFDGIGLQEYADAIDGADRACKHACVAAIGDFPCEPADILAFIGHIERCF